MPSGAPADIELLAKEIVDAAFQVHRTLGPGLLESVYEECVAYELEIRRLPVQRQVYLPISYKSLRIENGLRIDLLVGERIVVEIKSAERPNPVYEAQLLTYLKLSRCKLGFLINFNVPLIKDGIRRFAL
jgi:GxxExxY protein